MPTSPSNADLLVAARQAMLDLLSGRSQSYTTPLGVQVTKLNLDTLRNYISELEGLAALESINGVGGPARIEIGLRGLDVAR